MNLKWKVYFKLVVTGLICCLYTVIGGLKATVWIDTFQILIMISGLVLIVSQKFQIFKDLSLFN